MRRTPVAAFAAALTVTIAIGLQMPVALAADPVTMDPINRPSTSAAEQSGLVFLTQDHGNGAAEVYVWYPQNPPQAVIDTPPAMVRTTLSPATLHPNALGFRTADGYIYGIETIQSSEDGKLVQIGLVNGVYTAADLGYPTMSDGVSRLNADKNSNPTSFDAGTFGADATADIMYVLAYGGDVLYELDFGHLKGSGCAGLSPGIVGFNCLPTVTEVDLTVPAGGKAELADTADLFWLDGHLFGIYQYNCAGGNPDCAAHVYRINVGTSGVVDAGPVTVDDFDTTTEIGKRAFSTHGYGSQWVYPDGSFGFATTASSNLTFRCTMANAGAASGGDLGIQCAQSMTGPVGSQDLNDGTSNGIAGTISVVKEADPSAAPGDTVSYTITVTNNSGNSTGWTLDDLIPPGNGKSTIVASSVAVTGTSGSSAHCDVGTDAAGSSTLHCYTIGGPLPVEDSVTITYDAIANSFNSLCELKNNVVAMAFAPAPYAYGNATVTNSACTTPEPPMVDLGVTNQVRNITTPPYKAYAGSTTAAVGDVVQFSVTVDNGITGASEGDSTGWEVQDVLPAGLENISAVAFSSAYVPADVLTGATCILTPPSTTSPVTWLCDGPPLPLTASVIITFTATVAAGAPSEIKTDATVTHIDPAEAALDTDTANKEAFAAVKLIAASDPPPANHTSSTGGAVLPGGSPVAAGLLFVLAAGLATWLVWSRRRPVVS